MDFIDRYLFRGKQLDNGEWVTGCLRQGKYVKPCIVDEVIMFDVDPSTIGQCTGLKDKTGNLIFESDIVEILFNGELKDKGVICFFKGGFQIKRGDCYTNMNAPCVMVTRIIGNIHDNSDLIV